MIPTEVLEFYEAKKITLASNAFLFLEGEDARFYFQIIAGKVHMLNINPEGKEFVQGVFQDGQSFGEPPLFHGGQYPASAKTLEPTTLYKLHRDKLFDLLRANSDLHLEFTKVLTKRLMYKAMIMKEISSHDAQHRLLTFMDYLKAEFGKEEEPFPVHLTRQQLSNMLGIRVETVIRSIKQLTECGELVQKGRKIFR